MADQIKAKNNGRKNNLTYRVKVLSNSTIVVIQVYREA